jgi:hypothetical protein
MKRKPLHSMNKKGFFFKHSSILLGAVLGYRGCVTEVARRLKNYKRMDHDGPLDFDLK